MEAVLQAIQALRETVTIAARALLVALAIAGEVVFIIATALA